MKQTIGIVLFAALCVGCAIDRGVYSVRLNVDDYKCDPVTKDLIPKFRIDAKRQEIADQGRAALLGRWRVRINEDRAMFYEYTANRLTGAKKQLEYSCSFWEYDEYCSGMTSAIC